MLTLERLTGRKQKCSGTSAGALAAWVLAHESVTIERLYDAAMSCTSDGTWLHCFDWYVRRFMTAVDNTCGTFVPEFYDGVYVTTLFDRTPIHLLSTRGDVSRDIRASCFIPVLSGGFMGPDGYMDGAIGWGGTCVNRVTLRRPRTISVCMFPLMSHLLEYEHGSQDCHTEYLAGTSLSHTDG